MHVHGKDMSVPLPILNAFLPAPSLQTIGSTRAAADTGNRPWLASIQEITGSRAALGWDAGGRARKGKGQRRDADVQPEAHWPAVAARYPPADGRASPAAPAPLLARQCFAWCPPTPHSM